jgi:hypothetical protein
MSYSDANDAQNNYENYRFCYENGHHEWVQRASRNFDYFRNKQWNEADLAKRKAAGKPTLTLNVIESLIRTMKGVQRALRNDVRFQPVTDATAELAEVQDNLWLHTQNENDLDFLETDVWERGLITGRAYYDVRVDFDESMKGQVKIKQLRSQDVILDPAIDAYDPRTWPQLFTTKWVNRLDIEHWFGKAAVDQLSYSDMPQWYQYEDRLMAQRLGALPYYYYVGLPDLSLMRAFRLIERQYLELRNKEVFIDLKTGDIERIPEAWDRERIGKVLQDYDGEIGTMKRKVKQIKWRVTCENLVLHDSDSPYNDYTVVPFFPTFIDGETMGIVDSLIDPQNLYNKMTSDELGIITTTAHSGYKVKRGAVKNMTIEELERKGASSGFVVELDEIANLEKIQPSQLPAGHDRLSFKADAIMRQLAGVPNQIRGFAREDVAGEAIEMNQAGADLNYAAFLSNLHRSKKMLAERCQSCWQSTYDEERTIMINRGSTFKPSFESLTLNQKTAEGTVINDITKGRYTTILVPSPTRSSLSGEELSQLIEMRKELGIKIPDDIFIENSNIPHKAQLLARMKQDSNEATKQEEQQQEEEHQANLKLMAAKTKKEDSGSDLNTARANKAQGEAGVDPDAAYKAVEDKRMDMDHANNQAKLALDWHKEKRETVEGQRKDAIALTKIHVDSQHKAADTKVKEKQAMKPRAPVKKK